MYFSVGVTSGWDFVITAIASVQLFDKLDATLCSDGSCESSSGMTAGATFGYCKPYTSPLMRYGADVAASFSIEGCIPVLFGQIGADETKACAAGGCAGNGKGWLSG